MKKKVDVGRPFEAVISMRFVKYLTEEDKMIKSKKLKMGLSYACVSPLLALIASKFGLSHDLIAACIWSGTVIVGVNMYTHAITDIEHVRKTGK